jgi:t-SNARE complex subunit (syntaxin)
MIWLSKTWEWLKKNWKYVVTFGVPVVLSMIMNLVKSNQSLKNKVELKENEKDIENKARGLQEEMLQEANEDLHSRTKAAFDDWSSDLEEIQGNRRKTEHEIDTAEKATAAIKEKLK